MGIGYSSTGYNDDYKGTFSKIKRGWICKLNIKNPHVEGLFIRCYVALPSHFRCELNPI